MSQSIVDLLKLSHWERLRLRQCHSLNLLCLCWSSAPPWIVAKFNMMLSMLAIVFVDGAEGQLWSISLVESLNCKLQSLNHTHYQRGSSPSTVKKVGQTLRTDFQCWLTSCFFSLWRGKNAIGGEILFYYLFYIVLFAVEKGSNSCNTSLKHVSFS
jgi:hypothetical protein